MPGACILIVSFAYLLISAGIDHAIQRGARMAQSDGRPGGGRRPARRRGGRLMTVREERGEASLAAGVQRRDRPLDRRRDRRVPDPRRRRPRSRPGGARDPPRPPGRGRRRVRLGEVDARARRARAARAARPHQRGLDPPRRPRARRRDRGRAAAGARRQDLDDLPGRARLAEPGEDDRIPARRGDPPARPGLGDGGARACDLAADRGRRPLARRPGSASTRTSSPAACASA